MKKMWFSGLAAFAACFLLIGCTTDQAGELKLSRTHVNFVLDERGILSIDGVDTDLFDLKRKLIELGISDQDFIDVHFHVNTKAEALIDLYERLNKLGYKVYDYHKYK